MKRVSYGGESFLTTDAVADALLRLVAAFGDGHSAEVLEIPAVKSDGKTMIVQLVVGPMSELISVPDETPLKEPDTTAVVRQLRERAKVLSAHRPVTFAETFALADYDWDGMD